ncbi:MAG: hypothetical protein M3R08_06935 [Bacteroidota bacterium]|nr:hypothetical protein [Bacteroidota bacterium]
MLRTIVWIFIQHTNSNAMDPLKKMSACDRKELLSASADRLLGMIMMLNRHPRYHNTLDAIQLVSRLMELKERATRNRSPLHP